MKRLILLVIALAALVSLAATPAQATGLKSKSKVTICHKPGTPVEKTKKVPLSAVRGHLRHGDTLGPCATPPPPPPSVDDEDNPALYVQDNRTGYCADVPQLRVADNSWGIYADLLVGQPVPSGYVPATIGPNGESYC